MLRIEPAALLIGDQVQNLVPQLDGVVMVAFARGRDQMLADDLLFASLERRLRRDLLELGVFLNIIGTHAIQNEIGLVGHAHNMILAGMRQQAAFVDELDERETGVFLQRRLPLLRAQQHYQFNDRARLTQRRQAGRNELLSVRAHYDLGENERELEENVLEEGRDIGQCLL